MKTSSAGSLYTHIVAVGAAFFKFHFSVHLYFGWRLSSYLSTPPSVYLGHLILLKGLLTAAAGLCWIVFSLEPSPSQQKLYCL